MPLQVTVTSDITVDENTVLTPAVLNRLGTPTVDIRGTLDGQAAVGIGQDSVYNTNLANMNPNTVKGVGAGGGDPRDLVLDPTLKATDGTGVTGTLKVADGKIGTIQLTDLGVTRAKIETQPPLTVLGNPAVLTNCPPEAITLGTGFSLVLVAIASSGYGRAAGVSTITFAAAHGLVVGDLINVTGGKNNDTLPPTGIHSDTFNAFHVRVESAQVTPTFQITYLNPGFGDVTMGAQTNALAVRKIDQAKLNVTSLTPAVESTTQINGNALAVFNDFDLIPTWDPKVPPEAGDKMRVFLRSTTDTDHFLVSYKPVYANSRLLIEVKVPFYTMGSDSVNDTWGWLALFRDPPTNQNAIALSHRGTGAVNEVYGEHSLSCVVPAVNTNLTTFKLKFAGKFTTFNQDFAGNSPVARNATILPPAIFKVTELPAP